MRLLLALLLLLATPLRAFDCGGSDLLPNLPLEERLRLEARAGISPFPEGLFWQATRGDTTLTLFGTFHVSHEGTAAQLAALEPIGKAADFTFFEMNWPDLEAFQKRATTDASIMFITEGPTLPDMLPESEWQRLREAMALRGYPTFLTAKLKPIFVSMMLGFSPCQMKAQMQGEKGIDERLARALHDAGADTRSIEDSLTTARIFDRFSNAEQIAMLHLSLDLPYDPDDLQATMQKLYREGRIALLWEFGRALSIASGGATAEQDFAKFERILLTERNHAWIEAIEAQAPGKNVLVTVGAGHLPGKDGVLNLLREKGYTITPLTLEN